MKEAGTSKALANEIPASTSYSDSI